MIPRITLILLVITSLVMSPTDPKIGQKQPDDVQLRWNSYSFAEISWTQKSDAGEVYIHKTTPKVTWTVPIAGVVGRDEKGEYVSMEGERIVVAIPSGVNNDWVYFPEPGELYYLLEVKRNLDSGNVEWYSYYGPYELNGMRYKRYYPVVATS